MNVTCVELPSGRIIDLAAIVSLNPGYRQDRDYCDGQEVGTKLTRTADVKLTGGHQTWLQGPDAERLIEVYTRTRVFIKSPQAIAERPTPANPFPPSPPGYHRGEAVKLHGYTVADGRFLCPTCTAKLYPSANDANARPVFGTPFDQDTDICTECGRRA